MFSVRRWLMGDDEKYVANCYQRNSAKFNSSPKSFPRYFSYSHSFLYLILTLFGNLYIITQLNNRFWQFCCLFCCFGKILFFLHFEILRTIYFPMDGALHIAKWCSGRHSIGKADFKNGGCNGYEEGSRDGGQVLAWGT